MNVQHTNQFRSIIYARLVTLLTVAPCAVLAQAQEIELVGHLDPAQGEGQPYADVWGEGDYAYLAGWEASDVFIIDISDPANPQHVFTYPGGDFADVKVQDGIGYFASRGGGEGVHIVDLADPTSPQLLGEVNSSNGGFDDLHNISVWGDFLYLTYISYSRVVVFDISTPTAPEFVRILDTGSDVHDMTAIDGRLYTSHINAGRTEIWDVSDMSPTQAPSLLGTMPSGSSSHSNWPTADHNVLATARECSPCGVALWDISDPANPVIQSQIHTEDFGAPLNAIPHNPLIMGDFLYVSWYETGLQVFDISDPTNPRHVGNYDTSDGAGNGGVGNWGVYPFLGEDKVLLSDMETGLYIVDVSAVVPEPGTMALAAICLVAALGMRKRSALRA